METNNKEEGRRAQSPSSSSPSRLTKVDPPSDEVDTELSADDKPGHRLPLRPPRSSGRQRPPSFSSRSDFFPQRGAWPPPPHHQPRRSSRGSSRNAMDPWSRRRPLEELCNERAYLLANLQSQDGRSRRLLASLAAVEAQLAAGGGGGGSEARRRRKQAGLLSNKIAEASQQERLTLLRLGDLYVEIQAHERWHQAQQQQQQQQAVAQAQSFAFQMPPAVMMLRAPDWWQQQQQQQYGPPAAIIAPHSPITMWSPSTAMSPISLESMPGHPYVGVAPLWELPSNRLGGPQGSAGYFETVQEEMEVAEPPPLLQYTYVGAEEERVDHLATSWRRGRPRGSSSSAAAYAEQPPRDKRMSLPSLRLDWPSD